MTKLKDYPLFIIDRSRSHGRGRERDFVSCYSHDCKFVAAIDIVSDDVYQREYDKDFLRASWSDSRNGLRIRIEVCDAECTDDKRMFSLLKRAVKEVEKRLKATEFNAREVDDTDALHFATLLYRQYVEQQASGGLDPEYLPYAKVLKKIMYDYGATEADFL